jgi:hypothetical protein
MFLARITYLVRSLGTRKVSVSHCWNGVGAQFSNELEIVLCPVQSNAITLCFVHIPPHFGQCILGRKLSKPSSFRLHGYLILICS